MRCLRKIRVLSLRYDSEPPSLQIPTKKSLAITKRWDSVGIAIRFWRFLPRALVNLDIFRFVVLGTQFFIELESTISPETPDRLLVFALYRWASGGVMNGALPLTIK